VSVDIDKDVLQYGKMVYNAECMCADATHLPFREQSFDSIVSIETLEHIRNQKAFLSNIKLCLKKRGDLILSTPNKLYTSPFLPKPLNPYHMSEYYLGPLLVLLESHDFKVSHVYGGKKVKGVELIRRIFGSLLKFLISKPSLKPYLIDNLYYLIRGKGQKITKLVDIDPSLFQHKELKVASNIVLYEYFVVHVQGV